MLLTPFAADAQDRKTQDFVSKYEEKYGRVPNQFAADAYDGVYAILAACEQGGVTADMDASAVCDALKAAMTQISVDGLTGEGMKWEATGEVNKAPQCNDSERRLHRNVIQTVRPGPVLKGLLRGRSSPFIQKSGKIRQKMLRDSCAHFTAVL